MQKDSTLGSLFGYVYIWLMFLVIQIPNITEPNTTNLKLLLIQCKQSKLSALAMKDLP